MQSKTTPKEPIGKVSLREKELAKEKIGAVLDEFEKLFPEALPFSWRVTRATRNRRHLSASFASNRPGRFWIKIHPDSYETGEDYYPC